MLQPQHKRPIISAFLEGHPVALQDGNMTAKAGFDSVLKRGWCSSIAEYIMFLSSPHFLPGHLSGGWKQAYIWFNAGGCQRCRMVVLCSVLFFCFCYNFYLMILLKAQIFNTLRPSLFCGWLKPSFSKGTWVHLNRTTKYYLPRIFAHDPQIVKSGMTSLCGCLRWLNIVTCKNCESILNF